VKPISIALIGVGKIARDQHVPALAAHAAFRLIATASPNHRLEGVQNYPSVEALLDALPNVEAVSICTPPQMRFAIARYALERGRHVMLEKPPGATLSEVAALTDLAQSKGATLFATWHSREAAAVEPARAWLANRTLRSGRVTWKEDVRVWHPGQRWIWQAGGLGVFDPGINALSILTRIIPGALVLNDAELSYPSNCATPIAARLRLADAHGAVIHAEFDFRQTGPQSWDIDIETTSGRLFLSKGGSVMRVNDGASVEGPDREYANLYAHFETLARQARSDVDAAPLRLVADAFLCGRRLEVEPFIE
jgi:D-galactose 1-dehydrogenase